MISALRQEKKQLEQRCTTKRGRLRKVQEDIGFLEELNESLQENEVQWAKKMEEAIENCRQAESESKCTIEQFEEKVCILMAKLDGSSSSAPLTGAENNIIEEEKT